MPHTIEEELSILLRLQEIDTQLDTILKTRGELPEELVALRTTIEDLEARAHTTKEVIARLEQDISERRVRMKTMGALVKKYEAQQMSVRNNREYTTK